MKISILIPCHNEEKTIYRCVASCLSQIRPADEIIVVDDGSTDNSVNILKKFGSLIQVVRIMKNTGSKSCVQQFGLKYVAGDVFIATDADTVLDKDFIGRIEEDFSDPNVVAVAGYVRSLKHNWLTAVRELDYIIGQEIYKTAQSNINFLFVIPGCAGAFRTEIFKENILFDHDTVTEDLDFTYKFNKRNCRIVFDKKALVYTQDPADLRSYVNQMRRWYCGGWQNLLKHYQVAKKRPASALELSLIYIEGLIFSVLLYILPIINFYYFGIFLAMYMIPVVALAIYGSISRRRSDLLIFSPLYMIVAYVNSYVFFEQFIKEVVLRKKNMLWLSPERRV